MRVFTIIATILAISLIIFNAMRLNFDALLQNDSATALITIFCSLCVIVLLQVFRVSKKIEKLEKNRK